MRRARHLILADLGVSSMQLENPERGFSYKVVGPQDMRMNSSRGEPASQLLAHSSEEALASLGAYGCYGHRPRIPQNRLLTVAAEHQGNKEN